MSDANDRQVGEYEQILLFPDNSYNKVNCSGKLSYIHPSPYKSTWLYMLVNWFDFHLSSFSGVAVSFPFVPVHTFPGNRMLAMMIETIQIGIKTGIEPPSCLATLGTVGSRTVVVVTIFGGERRTTMIGKRVTSTSYKNTKSGDRLG